MFNCRHAAAAVLDSLERKPEPAPRFSAATSLSKLMPLAREVARQLTANTLSPCPATQPALGVGQPN